MRWLALAILCSSCYCVTSQPIEPTVQPTLNYKELLSNGSPVTALYFGNGKRCTATRIDARIYLTARHCIEDIGSEGVVSGWDGNKPPVSPIEDAWTSKTHDIGAILLARVLPSSISWARFAASSYVGDGYIEGYGCQTDPNDYSRQLRFASIESSVQGYIKARAVVCGGDSGGAVLTADGTLIGITDSTYKLGGTSTMTASLPEMGLRGIRQLQAREIADNK